LAARVAPNAADEVLGTHSIAVGDIPDYIDPELGALALLGPIIYRRLMTGEPFEPDRTGDLVETVLGPLRVRTHAPG
jgi:hypothetical protein